MNQGNIEDLTEDEIKELQACSDLIFVETDINGFFEVKVKIPTEMFPTDVFYTKEAIGDFLMSKFKLSIMIESNDGKFIYQPNRLGKRIIID
ncbi:hypothetical protein SAMN04488700_1708 [Carnobacterium iners]|uniref:Uncharacterized protein n=1 Tax=Carnobacterium iners TaxID=1073423 RepID=A0A1X7NAX3_9LACT|nr:hypothetical protein [Carnobacterium iners]SEK52476.1 hypothetical protein SAMN04488114_10570 [Carnobacterium iners]SMH34756.1 hypothetical protein SAMN04488700_1708 [Carnobacterium iners]